MDGLKHKISDSVGVRTQESAALWLLLYDTKKATQNGWLKT